MNLHTGHPILTAGPPLAQASAAVVALHGRGASAEDMLALASTVDRPAVAWIAPQAANWTWYPNRFLAPIPSNEPWLSSALSLVHRLVEDVGRDGVPASRVILFGFSQGGCLALEYAARHARRYGGLVGLSGGLIGPEGTSRNYPGRFDGTPAFLGCDERDPHIPVSRVRETTAVLDRLGAQVTERIYIGLGHSVNDDEIREVRNILDRVAD